MRKLVEPIAANLALWAMMLYGVYDVTKTALLAAQGEVYLHSGSASGRATGIAVCGGVILTTYLVVVSGPSLGRWLWFGLVACFFGAAILAILNNPSPPPSPYTSEDVVAGLVLWLLVCGPLVRFRMVPPPRPTND